MAGLLDGDTIALDFTTDGSAPDGTAEETHIADAAEEGITWTTWTSFAGGATVKWRMRYGRDPGTGFIWSNWSNTLSDTLNAPWAPSNLVTVPVHWWKVKDGTTVTVDGSTNIQRVERQGLGRSQCRTGDSRKPARLHRLRELTVSQSPAKALPRA
jgi:hypothetical protein